MELGSKRHRHCALGYQREKYDEPVWRLLGGARNPVQSYVTFGLKQYSTEQLIEVAKQLVAQGEKRLKMVVAVDPEDPSVDAARVRAVRHAVGDEVELMIDTNYLFSFNRALELCKLVERYKIIWFERTRMPLYCSPTWADTHRFQSLRAKTKGIDSVIEN